MTRWSSPADATALLAGAGTAVLAERAGAGLPPRRTTLLAGAGLVVAALVYPAARRSADHDGPAADERRAVATTAALLAVAAALPDRPARVVVSTGWLAHAAFDNTHHAGPGSRIPTWYPALCAGFDVVLAGLLLRRP